MRSLVDILSESFLDKTNKKDTNRRPDFWNAAGMLRNGVSRRDVGTTAARIMRAMTPNDWDIRRKYSNKGAAPSGVTPIEWQNTDWGDFDWKAFGYYLREEIIGDMVKKYGAIPSPSQCASYAADWNSKAPFSERSSWEGKSSQQVQINIETTNDFPGYAKDSYMNFDEFTGMPAIIISFVINYYEPGTKKVKKKTYVDDEGNEWKNYVSRGRPGRIGSKHQKTITVDAPDYENPQGGITKTDTRLNKYVFFHFTDEQLGKRRWASSW